MSRHTAPSLRRSRYSFTPDAVDCLTCLVCACVRRSGPSDPLAPWKRRMLFETRAYTGRVSVQASTRDFRDLADSRVRRKVRRTDPLAGSLQLVPAAGPGGRARGMNTGGFFHDSPGEPSPRKALNTAASAPSCAAVWSIRSGTRRRSATTKRIAPCYTRHTNDRLRRAMTPEGREARRRERVAEMLRPAPAAARGFSEFVSRWDRWRRGSRDRPQGSGVSTSRDRNRGSFAAVRESLPAPDRVPTRQDGRIRDRCRGPDQTRAHVPDR